MGDPSPGRSVSRPVPLAAACRCRRPAGAVRLPGPSGGRGHGRRGGSPGRRAQVRAARLGLARSTNATRRNPGRGRQPDGPGCRIGAGGGEGGGRFDRSGGSAAQPAGAQHAGPGPNRGRGAPPVARAVRPGRPGRSGCRTAAADAGALRPGDRGGAEPAGRAGGRDVRRPDPHEPARERGPVCGRASESGSRPVRPGQGASSWWSRMPGRAFPRRRCRTCSSGSIGRRGGRGSRSEGGSGIGLAVVRGLAEAMGGSAEARPSMLGGLAVVGAVAGGRPSRTGRAGPKSSRRPSRRSSRRPNRRPSPAADAGGRRAAGRTR